MAKLTSIFGTLVDGKNLQLIIDRSLDMFNVPVWKKYFSWGTPSTSLTYTTVIGAARVEAMASIVDRNSSAPLRSRAGLTKLQGEVPAIKQKFKMDEVTFREYLNLKGMGLSDSQKQGIMLDMLFGDLQKAGNAPHKRLDYLGLKMLSTGKIQITTADNPDGIVTAEIDLLMPDGNKYEAVADVWSAASTADPLKDIQAITKDFAAKGVTLSRILMDQFAFNNMVLTDSIAKYLIGRVNPNAKVLISQALVNEYLSANGLPTIELVNATMGVESDGVIGTVQPWAEGQVTFLPAGPVGVMHNAVAIESMVPVEKVSYANFDRVLLSKWSDNDPFAEFTACELNAFPGWSNIDQCAILDTKTKAS